MPDVSDAVLADKDAFAAQLAQTFEPGEIVGMLKSMGLRPSDLALGLGVHPRTIQAWLDTTDRRDGERQRDEILTLKALIVFLLRRGVLAPKQLAVWLVEPNDRLAFRRPLAVLSDESTSESLNLVMEASLPFLHPEPDEDSVGLRQTPPSKSPSPAEQEPEPAATVDHDATVFPKSL
jgi:hypothetical protein